MARTSRDDLLNAYSTAIHTSSVPLALPASPLVSRECLSALHSMLRAIPDARVALPLERTAEWRGSIDTLPRFEPLRVPPYPSSAATWTFFAKVCELDQSGLICKLYEMGVVVTKAMAAECAERVRQRYRQGRVGVAVPGAKGSGAEALSAGPICPRYEGSDGGFLPT